MVADIFARHLAENHSYLLPGEKGAARDLDDFVRDNGGGHCEYFATVMTVLLRKQGIPARMVGGYLAHEWSEDETVLIVRSRHAHAWVEVWDRTQGWFTVDATPARTTPIQMEPSLWDDTTAIFSTLWDKVRSFNREDRDAALAWMGAKLAAFGRWCWRHPLQLGLLLVALFMMRYLLRRWRAPVLDPAVTDYLAVLRRTGLERVPAETPRQLLARARTLDLTPVKLAALAHATQQHESSRYV